MGVRGDDLVEVVLEDDGDSDLGGPGGRRPGGPRRPWSRRRRRSVLAAGLVLAVAVAVPGSSSASTQALPVEGVPGLSVSLTAPLHLRWQVVGRIVAALPGGNAALVTTAETVEARDLESGAVLWSAPLVGGWCDLAASTETAALRQGSDPVAESDQGRQVVLCGLTDGTTIQALDPSTGRVLLEAVAESYAWSPSVVDGDVVLAWVGTAGHVVASRWSTTTGEQLWSTVGPEIDTLAQGVWPHADGPVITVEWSGGSMALDPSTGALLSVTDAPTDETSTTYRIELADGSTATQEYSTTPDGLDDARVRVERPDGSRILDVPGYLMRPSVDDGSAVGIVMVFDNGSGGTRAYDLATGDEVWSSALAADLLVAGRFVGWSASGELTALSAATGDVLWTRQASQANNTWSAVSDGRRMLSLEGPDLRLVARSLFTGREVWSTDQPWVPSVSADAYSAGLSVLPSGLVVLSSGDRTVVLGR